MTIFHTLKYSNIDIFNETDLNNLPESILSDWHKEIKGFALSLLQSISDIDTVYPMVECFISTIEAYENGELSQCSLVPIMQEITKDTSRDPELKDKIDEVIMEIIWHIFSVFDPDQIPNQISDHIKHASCLAKYIDEESYSDVNFDVYFYKYLMTLLANYDV